MINIKGEHLIQLVFGVEVLLESKHIGLIFFCLSVAFYLYLEGGLIRK